MIERQYVTRVEWKKHVQSPWNKSHRIWEHLKDYVPGWGYSKAEIDAFFEGEASGKKQVHWDRITSKPGTFTPSAHALVGAKHTASGLTIGHVIRASAADAFAWAQLQHGDLGGVSANQHHTESHTLASHSTKPHSALTDVAHSQHHNKTHALTGVTHTAAGLTVGWVIKATGATTFAWGQLLHSHLGSVTSGQHHAQNHHARHELGGADAIKLDDLAEPDASNSDLNVSTSRHGLFPTLSGHGAECYVGDASWLRLYDSTSIIIKILSAISTTTRNSNDANKSTPSIGWVKLKEVKLGEIAGLMKISFRLISAISGTVFGRIRVNGATSGDWGTSTERSTITTAVYSEDLGPFASQDLIQIYAKCEEEEKSVEVQEMRFKYDRAITMLGECVLGTPLPLATQNPYIMQNQDP